MARLTSSLCYACIVLFSSITIHGYIAIRIIVYLYCDIAVLMYIRITYVYITVLMSIRIACHKAIFIVLYIYSFISVSCFDLNFLA